MVAVKTIKPSMSAGELSPEMFGRVDTEHYQLGLALARNFFVDYHGGLTNRPGTLHVSNVNSMVRHFPFERSAQETYMLELGEKTLRVLQGGKYIMNGNTPLTVATPYTAADLPEIRYIQSVDVMTLFHANYPMQQIKHYARTDWRVDQFQQKSGPYQSVNIEDNKLMWSDGQTGTVNIYTDFDLFTADMVGEFLYLETTGKYFTNSWVQRMVAKKGDYCYYAGNYYECVEARSNSLTGDVPPTHTEGERWDGPDQDLPNDNDDHFIGIKWRYSNSGFGEVKITKFISARQVEGQVTIELPKDLSGAGGTPDTSWEYLAVPYTPDFDMTSPKPDTTDNSKFRAYLRRTVDYVEIPQRDTWYVWEAKGDYHFHIIEQDGWTESGGEVADLKVVKPGSQALEAKTYKWAVSALSKRNGYPACGAYYSDRLNLGGNVRYSQTIWASKTDSYNDFGMSKPLLADDSLTLNVAGIQLSEIEHLLPLNALLAFTSGGVWAVLPKESQKMSAEDPPSIDVQSYNGCSYLAPLITGGHGVYVQRGEKVVREIQYDFGRNSFVDANLCIRSSHIFRNRRIVSWAFAKNPYSLIWCVLNDGTAASLTYMKEQQVWGWTTHTTNGKFKGVSAVEEDERTAVYFVVERMINGSPALHVEYQTDRNFTDLDSAVFMDDAVFIDNTVKGIWLTLSGGVTWEHPEEITATTSQAFFDDSTSGKTLIIKHDGNVFKVFVLSVIDARNAIAQLQQVIPEDLRENPLYEWGPAIEDIRVMDYLDNQEVGIVADGMYKGKQTVSYGVIQLQDPALKVSVGLIYESLGKSLPLDLPGAQQSIKDQYKAVSRVNMEVHDTYGGFAGTSLDNMYEIKQREYEDYTSPLKAKTGIHVVDVSSVYDMPGQFYFQQPDPMPFSLLALIPEFEIGD
ncbi:MULTISPECIES: hypothetical protein [unclassified Vibrio]|uniref:hypothetical protein n=1 Tax=unclassified Vibrio TaxID=2614977 RepID=UPI0013617024|nr:MULTISPECIES: hypothetical protein [unclassified Vibrio]NAW60067.1 hypothetical protein [Vibrio sp. V36_P2S2PM302]NAX25976.1 hypothetical protein [Vibrio sp. V38_P2S17PM301]NAX30654.1 hypothetical protein [Vibrio sp. V37_P2S8PM304]